MSAATVTVARPCCGGLLEFVPSPLLPSMDATMDVLWCPHCGPNTLFIVRCQPAAGRTDGLTAVVSPLTIRHKDDGP